MSDLVKIHKDFNRSTVPFYQEKALELFTEITSRWNDSENFEPLIFSLSELKRALNLEGSKNSEYFRQFVLDFVKDTTVNFKIGEKEITGNVFSISRTFWRNSNPDFPGISISKKAISTELFSKKSKAFSAVSKIPTMFRLENRFAYETTTSRSISSSSTMIQSKGCINWISNFKYK